MIERDVTDGIVTLRLAHGKASAMDLELLTALGQELEAASEARAVVLTGSGSIFSAGVDLFRLVDEGPGYVGPFLHQLDRALRRLFAFPRPVVVAANGHAIAGGAVLLLAGDLRLMAEGNGRVGVPELIVGVPFPASAREVVRFAVPRRHLQALVYTGRTLPPDEALAHGLVDEVVPPDRLLERAHAAAERLAAIPEASFRLTKLALRREAVERMDRDRETGEQEMLRIWADPAIHQGIRDYLARTVRK